MKARKAVESATIEITPEMKAALERIRRDHFVKEATREGVVAVITRLALCYPETVARWFAQVTEYCHAEDMDQKTYLLSRIAANPRYRKVRFPA